MNPKPIFGVDSYPHKGTNEILLSQYEIILADYEISCFRRK